MKEPKHKIKIKRKPYRIMQLHSQVFSLFSLMLFTFQKLNRKNLHFTHAKCVCLNEICLAFDIQPSKVHISKKIIKKLFISNLYLYINEIALYLYIPY